MIVIRTKKEKKHVKFQDLNEYFNKNKGKINILMDLAFI